MVYVGRPLDPRTGHWAAGALALALLGGCSEPPSFELSWKLADAETIVDFDAASELSTVEQCSEVGVSKVRVSTYLLGDVCELADRFHAETDPDKRAVKEKTYRTALAAALVDTDEFPCFSAASGPALEPGDYTLLVQGLRRKGDPWACELDLLCPPAEPDPEAPLRCVAQASIDARVTKGGLPSLGVVLLSPSECDDGVDNDRDGRVDGRDPACILDPTAREATDASVTVFQTSVSFLDNPVIKPFNVGVASVRLEVSGEPLAVVPDYELDLTQWPYRLPLVSRGLEPGEYMFTATALDASGEPLTESVVRQVEGPTFQVFEDEAAYAAGEFEFPSERFLEPIVQPIAFNTGLLLAPGDTSGPSCLLGGYVANQQISLERVWIKVTDGAQTLDAAALGLEGFAATGPLAPVDEAGGWVSFDCPTAAVRSVGLTWGAYDIEVQGRIGADVCFETQMAVDLAPQPSSAQELYLERVLVDALPPAACRECSTDLDCSNQICTDFVCVNK